MIKRSGRGVRPTARGNLDVAGGSSSSLVNRAHAERWTIVATHNPKTQLCYAKRYRLDHAPTRRCDLENFHHADRSAGPCLAAALVEAGSIWKPQRQGYQSPGRRREYAQWSELTQGKPPRLARHCRRCARRRAPPVVRWSWRCTSLTLTHGHSRHASAVACPSRPNVLRMALRSTSTSTTSRVRAEPGTAAGAPIQQTSGTSRRTSHSSTCGGAAE